MAWRSGPRAGSLGKRRRLGCESGDDRSGGVALDHGGNACPARGRGASVARHARQELGHRLERDHGRGRLDRLADAARVLQRSRGHRRLEGSVAHLGARSDHVDDGADADGRHLGQERDQEPAPGVHDRRHGLPADGVRLVRRAVDAVPTRRGARRGPAPASSSSTPSSTRTAASTSPTSSAR